MPDADAEGRVVNPAPGATSNGVRATGMTDTTVIGFDFGLKRIGVAAGNTRTGTSQGLSTVHAKDGLPNWPAVERLIGQWLPARLVVGLPLNMDGSESAMAVRARKFGARAARRFALEVVYVDERLTTAAAEAQLVERTAPGKSLNQQRRKHRDRLAAELLLRTYLEAHRPGV